MIYFFAGFYFAWALVYVMYEQPKTWRGWGILFFWPVVFLFSLLRAAYEEFMEERTPRE